MKDGSVVKGDFAICTIPLGVLQSGSVKFTPALPADKLTAISRLKMASLMRLYLEFDTVFWERGV